MMYFMLFNIFVLLHFSVKIMRNRRKFKQQYRIFMYVFFMLSTECEFITQFPENIHKIISYLKHFFFHILEQENFNNLDGKSKGESHV